MCRFATQVGGIGDETPHGCTFIAGSTSVACANAAARRKSRLACGQRTTQAIYQATIYRVGRGAAGLIEQILQIIDTANDPRCPFNYLTGTRAESADTFRESFERDRRQPFTPKNFRDYRLKLLNQADALINIRVGMSESSAFELSYHIFKGQCSPILFLVWKHALIKTTLIRDLDDLCEVTYLEFEHADELREGIRDFFHMLSTRRTAAPIPVIHS
jgi:hypothetical protein